MEKFKDIASAVADYEATLTEKADLFSKRVKELTKFLIDQKVTMEIWAARQHNMKAEEVTITEALVWCNEKIRIYCGEDHECVDSQELPCVLGLARERRCSLFPLLDQLEAEIVNAYVIESAILHEITN